MSSLRKILFLSALLSTTVAFTTSLVATLGCSFVEVQAEVNQHGFGPKVGLGLHRFEGVGGQCYDYPDDGADLGWKFRAVQRTSIGIAVLGGLVLVVLLVATQFPPGECAMKSLGGTLLVCALLQGLTVLSVFKSDACTSDAALDLFGGEGYVLDLSVGCMSSRGSKLAIAATTFWALGSLLTACVPRLGGAHGDSSYTLIK